MSSAQIFAQHTLFGGSTCTWLVAPFPSSNGSNGLATTATLTATSDACTTAAKPAAPAVDPLDLAGDCQAHQYSMSGVIEQECAAVANASILLGLAMGAAQHNTAAFYPVGNSLKAAESTYRCAPRRVHMDVAVCVDCLQCLGALAAASPHCTAAVPRSLYYRIWMYIKRSARLYLAS
ncbi:hypothetical protein COO60DRAFT_664161 [Scenedesmus sp. NREL 46B-D3]|nr:hypothetical protein COO60DRAFT_664161 [Scenedesmus sp. NREL 46B-D3]